MNIGSAPPAVYADPQHYGPVPAATLATADATDAGDAPAPVSRREPVSDAAHAAVTRPDPNRLDPGQPDPAHRAADRRAEARREARHATTATEALEALRAAKREAEAARLHATQKIADLKAQLHLVEMLHVGDPAKRGEAAEQIARELAATVHDYIDAGGTMIPSSTPAPVATDATPAPTDTAAAVAATAAATPLGATHATDPAVLVAAAAVGGAIHADIATAQTAATAAGSDAAPADLASAVTRVGAIDPVAVAVDHDPQALFAREVQALARDLRALARRDRDDDGASAIDRTLADVVPPAPASTRLAG